LLSKNPVFRALALGGLAIGGAVAGKSLLEDEPADTTTAPSVGTNAATTTATTANNLAEIRKIREQEVADTIARQFALQNRQVQIAQEYQKLVNGTADLSKQEADRKKVEYEVDKQLKTQIADLDAKIRTEEEKKSFANQAAIAAYKAQKDELTAQAAEQKKLSLEALKNTEAERAKTVELQKQLGLMQQQSQANTAMLEAEQMRRVIAGEITQTDAKNAIDIAKIKEDGALKVAQLERQLANEKDDIRKTELRNQIDAIKAATDFAISEKEREVREKQALEESFAAGAVQAITQIADAFKPYKMAQDAIAQTWGKIGNAVDEFVNTGKFKFSDFARSVIQDLAKMIIKAQIFKAIQATLGFFGFSIPGLATGGPAKANQPYIVGERGPELFVPKSAGTVIPNNQLSASTEAMGTGRVNAPVTNNYITNNISALDAKSVAQLFAENRKTLLGVTETARREMAYGV
jgi:lambda family phage tail tape measure protein